VAGQIALSDLEPWSIRTAGGRRGADIRANFSEGKR